MKRIQQFAVASIMAAFLGAGVPAMAAEHTYAGQSANQQYSRDYRTGNGRNDDRRSENQEYQNREFGYAATPSYQPQRDYRYGDERDGGHGGRTAAIVGGGAAAGALIGAAADHGQGAVIGAVIGGLAGVAVNTAAGHHHER